MLLHSWPYWQLQFDHWGTGSIKFSIIRAYILCWNTSPSENRGFPPNYNAFTPRNVKRSRGNGDSVGRNQLRGEMEKLLGARLWRCVFVTVERVHFRSVEQSSVQRCEEDCAEPALPPPPPPPRRVWHRQSAHALCGTIKRQLWCSIYWHSFGRANIHIVTLISKSPNSIFIEIFDIVCSYYIFHKNNEA